MATLALSYTRLRYWKGFSCTWQWIPNIVRVTARTCTNILRYTSSFVMVDAVPAQYKQHSSIAECQLHFQHRCQVVHSTTPVPTVDTFHTTLHGGTTCEFHKFLRGDGPRMSRSFVVSPEERVYGGDIPVSIMSLSVCASTSFLPIGVM